MPVCPTSIGPAAIAPNTAQSRRANPTSGVVRARANSASAAAATAYTTVARSEEHTSELQSRLHLVCRLLLEKKKANRNTSLFSRPVVFNSSWLSFDLRECKMTFERKRDVGRSHRDIFLHTSRSSPLPTLTLV